MRFIITFIIFSILLSSCQNKSVIEEAPTISIPETKLDLEMANHLAKLPLKCLDQPLPYKSGIVLTSKEDLRMPQEHHPAFYGCFDWHSAVHGHWSLVLLLKHFPELDSSTLIRKKLDAHLTPSNIEVEMAYFELNKYSKSFERTYGWAWLLQLIEELYTWDDPDAQRWFQALAPFGELLSGKYQEYLPKLLYPIRVGEHTNTAFGLSFALDYAHTLGDTALLKAIQNRAMDFYYEDEACPISWEPSGYDFLSPCLQELDLMRKVLEPSKFQSWKSKFLKDWRQMDKVLTPARVADRSDGKLVHLDGLNFSRAWCLYPLQEEIATEVANDHLNFSMDKIVDGDYSGEHWLASFALYAFKKGDLMKSSPEN